MNQLLKWWSLTSDQEREQFWNSVVLNQTWSQRKADQGAQLAQIREAANHRKQKSRQNKRQRKQELKEAQRRRQKKKPYRHAHLLE